MNIGNERCRNSTAWSWTVCNEGFIEMWSWTELKQNRQSVSRSPELSSTCPGFPSQAISQFCSGASAASQSDPGTTVFCQLGRSPAYSFLQKHSPKVEGRASKINHWMMPLECRMHTSMMTTIHRGIKRRARGRGRPTGGHTTQSEAEWVRRAPSDMEVTCFRAVELALCHFQSNPSFNRPLLLNIRQRLLLRPPLVRSKNITG
ncbi:hypothetical protein B0T21DRAFT_123610 [Apiosordaria backusii]|uniref:Uncharacterized protein n=1 Tax=Apiosordaria backusii TaxID=314023 RepID=A0AA40K117_9PEZI|nr:hypothetical protein B0T21DRAFT_123610 [Apiosordaria backusii]